MGPDTLLLARDGLNLPRTESPISISNDTILPKLLSDERPLRYITNLDRYGFSYLLAEALNFKTPPRPFCEWLHGWIWWDDLMEVEDIIGPRRLPAKTSIIVSTEGERNILYREGYQRVSIGGLPFAYTRPQGIARKPATLLAIIGHSAEQEKMNVLDACYLDYLAEQRKNLESIYVSIFSLDRDQNIVKEILRRNLTPVNGANPVDKRSLLRTRLALEYVEYVSTNTFGSHVAYALAMGCKVSVFSPMYVYDSSRYLNTIHGHGREYVDRISYVSSEEYVRGRWSSLFAESPLAGYGNSRLGEEYIGVQRRLNGHTLAQALGWTVSGQIFGYTRGAVRRIHRRILIRH